MSAPPPVVFAGTPEFAVPCLEALGPYRPMLVLTQPDRPAGRGRRPRASPVKQAASQRGFRVEQPSTLDDPALAAGWGPAPDLLVVAAYGLILPPWMLQWPRLGCINVHASLLPRWRGASPIQYAILAGDRSTGISIMRMEQGLDSGPVYRKRALGIGPRETAGALHDRLAELGGELLAETLPALLEQTLVPEPQDESQATYAPKLRKSDALLNWQRPARALERQVRAFNPWPVSETRLSDGRRLRIWDAQALDTATRAPPGTVVGAMDKGIDVAAGQGLLRILELQPPSGTVMSAGAYLNAHSLEGARFGA